MNDRLASAVSPSGDARGPIPPVLVVPPLALAAPLADARNSSEVEAELADLLADLHLCVVNYVYRRRAEGAPVERVLPEVRCLVREAESCERWSDPDDLLVAQAERWSREAYADSTTTRAARRQPSGH